MKTEAYDYISCLLGEEWVDESLDDYYLSREIWSPANRWHHRLPQVSPVVPLLYWNSRADFEDVEDPYRPYTPMGFWAGHPKEILNRLTEEIRYFEEYWRDLPGDRGTKNLVWALTRPQRFFSLAHELFTAFFFEARDRVSVEPFFLDPQSSAGKPDILAHTPDRSFAIQCKSQDPTSARRFPYDLWQYFAGVFHRVVQDSGRSIHFNVNLDGRMDEKQVRKVAKRVSGLVRKGLSTPYPWRSKLGKFQLVDLGEFPRVEDLLRLRMLTFSEDDPFYDELVRLPSLVPGRFRCASLSVAGGRGDDVTEVIRKAVTSATKAATADEPMIIAVHLYHEIDFAEFPDRPLVQERLIPWSNQFFADNPQLAIILLSSNFEAYRLRPVGSAVGVKHGRVSWVMESPAWDHADVEALGI